MERDVGSLHMGFLPEGVETLGLQLMLFLLAGTLQCDKGIRLPRDVGNCPSCTTDVTHVLSSQRELSSMLEKVKCVCVIFMGLPMLSEKSGSALPYWLLVHSRIQAQPRYLA